MVRGLVVQGYSMLQVKDRPFDLIKEPFNIQSSLSEITHKGQV